MGCQSGKLRIDSAKEQNDVFRSVSGFTNEPSSDDEEPFRQLSTNPETDSKGSDLTDGDKWTNQLVEFQSEVYYTLFTRTDIKLNEPFIRVITTREAPLAGEDIESVLKKG